MNNYNSIKLSMVVAAGASMAFMCQTAKADQLTTMYTTITSTTPGPGILVTDTLGHQGFVATQMSTRPILFVTTGAQITGFTCYTPDDLITRRDDLLARILSEKASGKLTNDQANSLISEVMNVDATRLQLSNATEENVEHVKEVKRIYRSYDRVSNDILKDSRQGNSQLAGKYSYWLM